MLVANYGSNLSQEQFARRCPSAKLVGTGTIKGHRLTFTGYSHGWKGSVATIKPKRGERVLVAVYRLHAPADVRTLDRCEGFPSVYGCEEFTVHLDSGKRVKAWTYVKRDQREGQPSTEYLKRIAQGYKDHGLDTQMLAAAVCALPPGTPTPLSRKGSGTVSTSGKKGGKAKSKAKPKGTRPRYGTARAPYGRHPNGDPIEYPGEKPRTGAKPKAKAKGKRKGKRKGKAKAKPARESARLAALKAQTCGGKGCTPDLDGGAECPWCGDATCEDHCPECCPTALAQFGDSLAQMSRDW